MCESVYQCVKDKIISINFSSTPVTLSTCRQDGGIESGENNILAVMLLPKMKHKHAPDH